MPDAPMVCVVLGAGASHDAYLPTLTASKLDGNWVPPLARDLFSSTYWRDVGGDYPGMKLFTTTIAHSLGSAFNLERALREFADDTDPAFQQAFKQVPLYLRDVIYRCSRQYVDYPGAHVKLMTKLRPGHARRVCFITLNYDDFIERALHSYSAGLTFARHEDYVRHDIVLFKAHGSIDWAVRMGTVRDDGNRFQEWERPVSEIDLKLIDPDRMEVVLPPKSAKHWFGPKSGVDFIAYYPLLTAPLAGKSPTDIVAPSVMGARTGDFLSDCRRYLIVGSSGLDDDLLDFLNRGIRKADLVHVVSGRPQEEGRKYEYSNATLDLYRGSVSAFANAAAAEAFPGGFVDYLESGQIESLLL